MKFSLGSGVRVFLYGLLFSIVLTLLTTGDALISRKTMDNIVGVVLKQCYICPIIDLVIDAMATAVDNIYSKVSSGLVAMLSVLYALWIAMFVMGQISVFKQKSTPEFFENFIRKTILVIVVAIILSSASGLNYVLQMVVFPLINSFMQFGLLILNQSGADVSCSIPSDAFNSLSSVFSELSATIKCLVEALHKSIAPGIVLGGKMLSTDSMSFWGRFIGLFLFVFFIILDMLFPLQIFDSLFRLAIMLMLLPVAIMFAAFELTRNYVKKIVVYIAAVAVHLGIISVVFGVCITVIEEVMLMVNDNYFDINSIANMNDEQLKNKSSIEMNEIAMIAVLIYMLYILNLFNEMVGMILGIDGLGDGMSGGVKKGAIRTGLGVGVGSGKLAKAAGNLTFKGGKAAYNKVRG